MTAPKKTLADKLAEAKAQAAEETAAEVDETVIDRSSEIEAQARTGRFFDTYEDEGGGGGMYLSGLEKDVLYGEGAAFPITAVRGPSNDGYKGKSRFVLSVEIEGDPRLLGLDEGVVFSRDRMILKIQDWLAQGGEPPLVVLAKQDRSWVLEDAEPAPYGA